MKIRRVTEDDVDEIIKLRRDNFDNIAKNKEPKETYEILIQKNNFKNIKRKINDYEMFCFFDNSGILGIVDFRDGEVGGMFVRFDSVRKGIGTGLMDFIEKHARKRKYKKIWLESAKDAKKFYTKMGYIVKENIQKNNTINFIMEKRL